MGKKRKKRGLTRARRAQCAADAETAKRIKKYRRVRTRNREENLAAEFRGDLVESNQRDTEARYQKTVRSEFSLREWGRQQSRVKEVYKHVMALRPQLGGVPYVRLMGPLGFVGWKNPVCDWEPEGKGSDAACLSLARHLLGPYEVPRFLLESLMRPGMRRDEVKNQIKVASKLAGGESIYKHYRGSLVPSTLTRRMCHELLSTPVGFTLMGGVRRAQVVCHGGDRKLAKAMSGGYLSQWQRPERFWDDAIHWFCRQDGLDLVQLDPVCDYFAHELQEDRNFNLKGRTWRSVVRAMNRWHDELNRELRCRRQAAGSAEHADVKPVVYRPSGFEPGHWSLPLKKGGKEVGRLEWAVQEILDSLALADEGMQMGHCVASYGEDVLNKESSIWSLVCNHKRMLTLEVDPARRAVTQIRGKFNRLAEPREMILVKKWADRNGLAVVNESN